MNNPLQTFLDAAGIKDVVLGPSKMTTPILIVPPCEHHVRPPPQPTPEQQQQQAYLDHLGTQCPHCGSGNICGEALDVDADMVMQPVSCHACGASWTDEYKLTGFSNLVVPQPET